jgi:hypothetical protein
MKYLLLIYHNQASRELWGGLSEAEKARGLEAYAAFTAALAASGELVMSEALADPSRAKRVTVRQGRAIATDGPFAEGKEHLAGIYLVECSSVERAVEIAAKLPDAEFAEVEVWPVRGLDVGEW